MNSNRQQDTRPEWLARALECAHQVGLAQAFKQLKHAYELGQCKDIIWPQCLENLGLALSSSHPRLALDVYDHIATKAQLPASAWLVVGHLQDQLGQRELAVESLMRVLLAPEALPQHVLKAANLLVRIGNQPLSLSKAIAAYETMGRPVEHAATLLYIAQQTADWPLIEELTQQLRQAYMHEPITRIRETPRTNLLWCNDEAINLAVVRAWSNKNLRTPIGAKPLALAPQGRRLRIAYLSSDFRDHPTARLIMGLLRHHDRRAVEVFMYCSGWDDGSKLRKALVGQCDHVHTVSDMSDEAAAALIRTHAIDVLVELNGPTRANRMGILSHRPAPVQISYLGWPASVGGRVVDYVVGDAHTIPDGAERAYPEKVIRLDPTYQVNDHAAWHLPQRPTREQAGLPSDPAIQVLGMFNAINKVHQEVWCVWANILQMAPQSVLWLLDPGKTARGHILQAAQAAGLDARRLVFAPRLPLEAHLARLRCCDLMLDPWPYGGHTSTADALFAGVPVLTLEGRNFAGRVSSGLLLAAGLDNLVADSPQAYVQYAVHLLNHRNALAQLQTLVRTKVKGSSIFNAALRARQLEQAYRTTVQRAADGLPPVHIRINTPQAKPLQQRSPMPLKGQYRVAVVTPYYRIESEKLQRCCASVAAQSWPCDHILVADGEPQTLPEGMALIHLVLPSNVGNTGATPRALGAQYALSLGYDAVAFLDADNWYEPEHIQQAVQAMEAAGADVAFARRQLVFPDGEVLHADDSQDIHNGHVDTNCYVLSKRVAFLLGMWALYPREFGSGEDRYIKMIIDALKIKTIRLSNKTVWYETHWARHYQMANKTPVAPVRKPERTIARHWDAELFAQRTGLRFLRSGGGQPTTQGRTE